MVSTIKSNALYAEACILWWDLAFCIRAIDKSFDYVKEAE